MSFGKWLASGIHKVAKAISQPVYDVVNFVSGGALDRQEQAKQARRDLQEAIQENQEQEQLAKEAQAMERNQALRQSVLAAQEADLNAKGIGEQSRSAEINKFQQESAALAAGGASGISAGSPYMAAEASINEVGRQISNWFDSSASQLSMSGERTSMFLEGARFSDRMADANIRKIQRNEGKLNRQLDQVNDALSPLNTILDFMGGTLSTLASVYSLGVTAKTGFKALSAMAQNAANEDGTGGWKNLLTSELNISDLAAEMRYAKMTGDNSYFKNESTRKNTSKVNQPGASLAAPQAGSLVPASPISSLMNTVHRVNDSAVLSSPLNALAGLKAPAQPNYGGMVDDSILAFNKGTRKSGMSIASMYGLSLTGRK